VGTLPACDERTDRQTDGRTAKSRTRIADSRQNEISQTDDRPATDLIIGDALNPPGEGAGFADYRLINSTYVSVSVTNIHEFLNPEINQTSLKEWKRHTSVKIKKNTELDRPR